MARRRINIRPENRCGSCGYTWAPRGHHVSRACPNCRSTNVTVPTGGGGCLGIGCLVMVGLTLIVGAMGAVGEAMNGPNGGAIKAGLGGTVFVGMCIFALVQRSKRKAAADQAQREEAERVKYHEFQQQQQRAEYARQQEEAAAAERARQERWARLVARFGEESATKIFNRELWVGATREMVIEMFGQPNDVAEKVLKTKTKYVFRYDGVGGPRGLKVKLDDDEVVGWDK